MIFCPEPKPKEGAKREKLAFALFPRWSKSSRCHIWLERIVIEQEWREGGCSYAGCDSDYWKTTNVRRRHA